MVIDTQMNLPCHNPREIMLRLFVFLLLAGIGASTPAIASEFSIDPYIQGGARFNSNPRFQSNQEKFDSAWGSIFDARLPMELRSERTSISLEPRLVYSFYPDSDDDDLEDRDKYLTGTASRLSRLSNFGASYGYTELSLRTSEFQNAGDSSSGGSGQIRVFSQDKQQRWFLQPFWQYQFSAANSVTLNGDYEDVTYDEKISSRRFDYTFSSASLAFQHAFNERHDLSLQARFTKFDSQNNDIRIENGSKTNGLSLIYNYSWSETTDLSADIGWARTKNKVMRPNNVDPVTGPFCDPNFIIFFPCETKSDSANFIGNLSATRKSETVEYNVTIGQSITPNSNGAEVLRFNIDATAAKSFTERVSGQLGVTAFTQDNIGDSEFDFGRDYIRGNVRLNYRFKRKWSVYGAYSYTFNTESRTLTRDRTIRDHHVSMGISFSSDGWRW